MARPIRKRRRDARAGFTLVELSIVLTVIGILAVLAVVGYSKYIRHSKLTEAQAGISAIRIAQEDYRAEKGTYADIGKEYCPGGAGVSDKKVGWNPECSGGSAKWNTLPVHIAGAVQFKYATVAPGGTFSDGAHPDITWVKWGTPPAGPWYVVVASCDLDGQANTNTLLVGSSFDNQIFSQNEGN